MNAHLLPDTPAVVASTLAAANVAQLAQPVDVQRRRDAYLATVAHEMRNALAPLTTTVDLLASSTAQKPDPRLISVARRQVRQLSVLTEDLLDIGRAVNSGFQMVFKMESVNDMVSGAVVAWRVLAEAKDQSIDLELPSAALYVRADRLRFSQALQNVIGNAVKFTPEHGRIAVKVWLAGGIVKVSVSDTGEGIPAAHLAHIFELFYSVHREGGPTSGFGIGLALARQLVEAHGGTIGACSEVGEGTSFTISLPLALGSDCA